MAEYGDGLHIAPAGRTARLERRDAKLVAVGSTPVADADVIRPRGCDAAVTICLVDTSVAAPLVLVSHEAHVLTNAPVDQPMTRAELF